MTRCKKCGCFHGYPPVKYLKPEDDCGFDIHTKCKLCNLPVKYLSTAGADICPWCDLGVTRDIGKIRQAEREEYFAGTKSKKYAIERG